MCIAHGLVMASMRYAPASVLQPFNYFALPRHHARLLVFGTMIEGFALLGALIIVVAGLIVMWRERYGGEGKAQRGRPNATIHIATPTRKHMNPRGDGEAAARAASPRPRRSAIMASAGNSPMASSSPLLEKRIAQRFSVIAIAPALRV